MADYVAPPTPADPVEPEVSVYVGDVWLERATAVSYTNAQNKLGAFSFTILHSDDQFDLLDYGRVIVFKIGGVVDFIGKVDEIIQQTIAPGEEAEQTVTYQGRRIDAELDWAEIFPALDTFTTYPIGDSSIGLATFPFATTRYFNWAFSDLDRSAWTSAVQLFQAKQHPPLPPPDGLDGAPEACPSPNTYWIAPRSININDVHPVGEWYTYQSFTVPSGVTQADVFAAVAPNGSLELFIDEIPVIVTDFQAEAGTKLSRARIGVRPGTHTIASRIEHLRDTEPGDITALWYAVFPFAGSTITRPGEGLLGSPMVVSSSVTKAWDRLGTNMQQDDPDYHPVPGPTHGQIIRTAVAEAQARDVLVTWDVSGFTDAIDSIGTSWPEPNEVTIQVGKSINDLLDQMCQGGDIDRDITYDPDAPRTLDVWVKGEGRTESGVTIGAGSALSISHHGTDDVRNTMLSTHAGGLMTDYNPGSVGTYGPREAFLGQPDVTLLFSAFLSQQKELEALKDPTESTTIEHLVAAGNYRPGQVVNTLDRSGADGRRVCRSKTVETDEDGNGRIRADMDVHRDDLQDRAERVQKATAHGTLDGRTANSVQTNASIISSTQISPVEIGWSIGGGTTIVGDRGDQRRPTEAAVFTMLRVDCDVAGTSGSTTIRLEKDGSVVGTVTVASGQRHGSAVITPVLFTRSNYGNVQTTAAGGHVGVSVTAVGVPVQ